MTDPDGMDLQVRRDSSDLELNLLTGKVEQIVKIASANFLAYYLNLPYTAGLGFPFERNKEQRFAYPKIVFITLEEDEISYARYYPCSRNGKWIVYTNL